MEDDYDEEEEDETIDAIQKQLKQLRGQTDTKVALLVAKDFKEGLFYSLLNLYSTA